MNSSQLFMPNNRTFIAVSVVLLVLLLMRPWDSSAASAANSGPSDIQQFDDGISRDFGDAPSSYGVASNHYEPESRIGEFVDAEVESFHSISAEGDDNNLLDDEDGIVLPNGGAFERGTTGLVVELVAYNEAHFDDFVEGWVDFNRNGEFDHPEEQIGSERLWLPRRNLARNVSFEFDVPEDAACGDTYARFRISSDRMEPDGDYDAGETQDYKVQIDCLDVIPPSVFPLSCDGTIYHVHGNQIYKINATEDEVVIDERFASHNNNMNAIGYNPVDNYLYAFDSDANIIRIGEDGEIEIVGSVPEVPNLIPVGSFFEDGTYVVGNGGGPFHQIDLYAPGGPQVIKTVTPSRSTSFHDFAVSPLDFKIYAKNDNSDDSLINIDWNTGVVTEIGPSSPDNAGAVWFDSSGNFYTYSLTHDTYYSVDTATGAYRAVGSAPDTFSNTDAAACPYGVFLELDIDDAPSCEAEIDMFFQMINSSLDDIDDVVFEQTLPPGFRFTQTESQIENKFEIQFAGDIEVVLSDDATSIRVTGITIAEGVARINLTVEQTSNAENEVSFSAKLTDLPGEFGDDIFSDDPSTSQTPDNTTINVITCPLISCTSDPFLFNTGYDGDGGKLSSGVDLMWTSALGPADGDPTVLDYGPAYVAENPSTNWAVSPFGNAEWISYWEDGWHPYGEQDVYYKYEFVIDPTVDLDLFSINMDFFADNNIHEIFINGNRMSLESDQVPQYGELYESPGYRPGYQAAMTLTGSWIHGRNQIIIQNRSINGAEGILAQVTSTQLCFSAPPPIVCPAGYEPINLVNSSPEFFGDESSHVFGDTELIYEGEMPYNGNLLLTGWVMEGHPDEKCPISGGPNEAAICNQNQNGEHFDVIVEQWDYANDTYAAAEPFFQYRDNEGANGLENYYFESGPHVKTDAYQGAFRLTAFHPGPDVWQSSSFQYGVCVGGERPVQDISIDLYVPDFVEPNQIFGADVSSWNYTIRNLSATERSNSVTFTDIFSPGLVDATPGDLSDNLQYDTSLWNCVIDLGDEGTSVDGTFTCTALDQVFPGDIHTFRVLNVEVPPTYGTSVGHSGTIDHVAVVSSNPQDELPQLPNNTAVGSTEVKRADLTVLVEGSPDPVKLEQFIDWEITAINIDDIYLFGGEDAEVTFDIPAGLDYIDMPTVSSNWNCIHSSGTIVCEIVDGEFDDKTTEMVVTVRTHLPANFPADEVTGIVGISAATFDPDTTNNTASDTLVVERNWVMPAGYEAYIHPYAHLMYFEPYVNGSDPQVDQPLDEWVNTPLQAPISTTFGITLTHQPTLTVEFCAGPNSAVPPQCGPDSIITGAVIANSYTITDFAGISSITPFTKLFGIGSTDGRFVANSETECVDMRGEYQGKTATRECMLPYSLATTATDYETIYQWQQAEFTRIGLKTKGGRALTDEGSFDILLADMQPDLYDMNGSMSLTIFFHDDVKLGGAKTVDVANFPITLNYAFFAPFAESNDLPESAP